MALKQLAALGIAACMVCALAACGKKEPAAAPALAPVAATVPPSMAPATPTVSAGTAPPASAASATVIAVVSAPAASSDPDNPTPLPSRDIRGVGVKRKVVYYYALNAAAGTIKVTATAKNSPSGATQALAFGLYDLKANKLCSESQGNTNSDKTITLNCLVDKAQPLILRLDLSEETIDYSVLLEGSFELPAPLAAGTAKPPAGAGSTDIDEPTRLTGNRIKGDGIQKAVSYYYAFNAGPGELVVTGDGKNSQAAMSEALRVGLYTLRSERLCELSLGNTTLDKRGVMSCKLETRQPVILRLDLAAETVDFRARFDGPFDFEAYTPPSVVTIALDAAVLFDTGKAVLKPEAQQTLHEAASRVKKFADASVLLSGHTDNVGSGASNQLLSEKRAAAVRDYFVSREGVPAAGLAVKGYGKSQPIADNGSEAGRSRNRRVDVVITPKAK